ncbi:MAG: hypothetical protein ACSLFI_01010 [Solirubrobacterales bacterium]
MPRKSLIARITAAILMVAALSFAVTACGSDDSDSSSDTTTAPKPVAQIDPVTGVDTKVTLDAGFVEALTALKVAPAPVGDATISKAGVAAFPITGGNVTYYDPTSDYRPFVQGILMHDGSGLSLTAGKTVVELTDFVIDPGTSTLTGTVSVDGKVAAEDALLFNLDGSTLKPLISNPDGTATLEGTTVKLSDDAAGLLNDTFGIKDLKGGLVIGISAITVKG